MSTTFVSAIFILFAASFLTVGYKIFFSCNDESRQWP